AGAAEQLIVAVAADQGVVAVIAVESVGAGAAGQGVRARRSRQLPGAEDIGLPVGFGAERHRAEVEILAVAVDRGAAALEIAVVIAVEVVFDADPDLVGLAPADAVRVAVAGAFLVEEGRA